MPLQGAYIAVERGTLVFPWGKNKTTIEVMAVMPATEEVAPVDFSGPGMDGYSNNATPRPSNTVMLRGSYVASDTTAMIGRTGMRGTGTIQLGTGETWAGTCILVSSEFIGDYGQKQNQESSPKRANVQMTVKFAQRVTRTPIPAGT